ncbi:MAG: ferredoxin--NADP(+) reductase [Gammaproteobacteria bacterium]|jgi:ferredoxin-NADP reductase|nr:ferredoxin--NADP(+) reductase [Gammaproteobacteria bacterium]
MAIELFNLVLKSSKMLTPNTKHMTFVREDGKKLDYIPGQFVTFTFDGSDGKPKRRSYSISSIYGQSDEIEIAISFVQGGIASEALFKMEPGQKFPAMGPAGRLILQEEPISRCILMATGTGVAPYRCMLPQIAEKLKNPDFTVELFLGVRLREDLLYGEDFVEFAKAHPNFKFHAYYSREDSELKPYEHKGYVQHAFANLNLKPGADVIYLCGNPNMIDEAFQKLVAMGFATKDIRREKYISSN